MSGTVEQTVLVKVSATDDDGDPLTYSLTTVPRIDSIDIDSCQFADLSVCLFVCLSASLSVCLFACLSASLSACLSDSLSVC